jgi:PhnB protein
MSKKKVIKKGKKLASIKKVAASVKKGKKVVPGKKVVKATKAKAVKTTKKKVLAIPNGYHSITPYLVVTEAAKAIEFYKKAFSAKEMMRMEQPGGKVGHAELKIGDAKIMLADECPEMHTRAPAAFGGSPITIHLYTKKVDEVVARAVSLGAALKQPVTDMFYGDRAGTIEDPFGHIWHVATHIEDVTPAKMRKRLAEMGAQSK